MNLVWIIADIPEHAFELLSKAVSFGKQITAFVNGDQEVAEECFSYGANQVKLLPLPANKPWEQYSSVLAREAETEKPDLILVGATRRGKTLAAHLAGLLDCPCVTESKKLEVNGDSITMSRTIFGGLAEKELESNAKPLIVTIPAGIFEKAKVTPAPSGEVTKLDIPESAGVEVLERKDKQASSVNLAEADIVVGVGRGFGEQKNVQYAEELAKLLGGEVGCSRPVAEDLHWLPEERYIGISGAVIKPNLYLCAGVSGQIQHVYGIRDAKMIVAIDKNENAPIFKVADYYIVGDLLEVLPEIISALKQA